MTATAPCTHPDVTYCPDGTRVCAWCETPVDGPDPQYRADLKERALEEFDKHSE